MLSLAKNTWMVEVVAERGAGERPHTGVRFPASGSGLAQRPISFPISGTALVRFSIIPARKWRMPTSALN